MLDIEQLLERVVRRVVRKELAQMQPNLVPRAEEDTGLKFREAAKRLGCGPRHVSRMVARGEIGTSMIGGARRIPLREVTRLLALVERSRKPLTARKPPKPRPPLVRRAKFDAAAEAAKLRDLLKRP